MTNADGVAETDVQLGDKTGIYNIGISVLNPEEGFLIQNKTVKLLGFNVLSVVIARARRTRALHLRHGTHGRRHPEDRRRKHEESAAVLRPANGIVAVLAGTLVTAVIQSSSATTVMVIGFINAGLLNLTQAIGIIFGANIGTTVTAQIISFNLSGLALPAITIGFVITLSKRRFGQGLGRIDPRIRLALFGMTMMSDELKLLADFPGFREAFRWFDCAPAAIGGWMPIGAVLGAILIGLVATMLIQSSSAAMGIVPHSRGRTHQLLDRRAAAHRDEHRHDRHRAARLAHGEPRRKTGGAGSHALQCLRRAAHACALSTFRSGRSGFRSSSTSSTRSRRATSLRPTRRTSSATSPWRTRSSTSQWSLLLLPFLSQFAKLCNRLLPIPADEKIHIQLLEPNLLATPSIALKQAVSAIHTMVEDALEDGRSGGQYALHRRVSDKEKYEALAQAEERIDAMQAEVTAYLVQITRRPLTEPQSELVPLLMHCTNDAERIADHTALILQLTDRLLKTGKKISLSGKKDLRKLWNVLDDQARNTISALGSTNPEQVKFALKDERRLQKMAAKLEDAHTERLRKGKCQLANAVIFIEMLGEMTKIGERLSNIAERTPEIQKHYIELQK